MKNLIIAVVLSGVIMLCFYASLWVSEAGISAKLFFNGLLVLLHLCVSGLIWSILNEQNTK